MVRSQLTMEKYSLQSPKHQYAEYRIRITSFPTLFTECLIQWLSSWYCISKGPKWFWSWARFENHWWRTHSSFWSEEMGKRSERSYGLWGFILCVILTGRLSSQILLGVSVRIRGVSFILKSVDWVQQIALHDIDVTLNQLLYTGPDTTARLSPSSLTGLGLSLHHWLS